MIINQSWLFLSKSPKFLVTVTLLFLFLCRHFDQPINWERLKWTELYSHIFYLYCDTSKMYILQLFVHIMSIEILYLLYGDSLFHCV